MAIGGRLYLPDKVLTMNSTSFEPRHAQYNAATLVMPVAGEPPRVNLTSFPKKSFQAPTAEDFDKGARTVVEERAPSLLCSLFPNIWSKFKLPRF
ncbi:hypothetical protein ALP39_03334 [Pseudomonas marginalis pv. marginalis]|nr:hypothetical protein ALP39_03334 [Pseudomonas marginalis pv. marginalis]